MEGNGSKERLAAGARLGRYEIVALVGAGGMGQVYRARDTSLRRDVAVKVLAERLAEDGERRRRFEREARAAAELEHPNVIAVHDAGVEGGVPFIVTELLDGRTLADVLRDGPLPRARAVAVAADVARGAAAAHDRGIAHRDLKPANVFICRDGRVKILDFGIAGRAAEEAPAGEATTVTEEGRVMGTPAYMAPEQVRGLRAESSADVFAMGAMLYEMVSGRRPFAGESLVEVGHAILKSEPEALGDAPLDAIVRRCLEKEPAARWRSARDLAFALEAIGQATAAPPPARRRSAAGMAVAALGGLAAMAAVGWAVWPPPSVVAPRYTRITFHPGGPQVSNARFAPDGSAVLYTWLLPGERSRVYSTTPGRPEARPLTEPGTQLASVSSTGDMLLVTRRPDGKLSLGRAPIAGGAQRILMEEVGSADFSPDGRELAVVRRRDGSYTLEYPAGRVLLTSPSPFMSPRVSPRGDLVAFIQLVRADFSRGTAYSKAGTVNVVDREGRRRTLGAPWSEVNDLAWEPGGDEIWVAGRRDSFQQLYAVALDGRERIVLQQPAWISIADIARDGRVLLTVHDVRFKLAAVLAGRAGELDLTWYDQTLLDDLSPDGRLVLFHEGGEAFQERSQVFVRGTDGSPAVDLGAGAGFALSPDGRWALVAPDKSRGSLALVPTGAGDARPLPRGALAFVAQAYFLAEGERILLRANATEGQPRLWVQELAGGDPRPFGDEGIAWLARPSPDGSRVAVCRFDGTCSVVPLGGGAPAPLPAMAPPNRPLQFSPDGTALLVGRFPDNDPSRGRPSLWWHDLVTGEERLLREIDVRGNPSPWGYLRLTPDASSFAYTYGDSRADLLVVEGLR